MSGILLALIIAGGFVFCFFAVDRFNRFIDKNRKKDLDHNSTELEKFIKSEDEHHSGINRGS